MNTENTLPFEYSDGQEIELEILEILDAADDLSSDAVIAPAAQAKLWAARYHLSPERANLLRHFDWTGLRVLELGAGMGAISRFLAEQAASLYAVEGSPRRYAALEKRLQGLDNWRGRVERIEDLDLDERFDVICLIGVLEYAALFCKTPPDFDGDAHDYLLAKAKSFLAPGGVLLLGIENALGIKYWSGAGEDHTGRLFDSITGYDDTDGVRTFPLSELHERGVRRDLPVCEAFLPFPDYKLPSCVIRPELARLAPDLAAELACFHALNDPHQPRSVLFPDYLALDTLSRAGLFDQVACSYLLAFTDDTNSSVLTRLMRRTRTELGWHYAAHRRLPTRTVFFHEPGEDFVQVRKERLTESSDGSEKGFVELEAQGLRVRWRIPPIGPLARGERLRLRLARAAYHGREDDLVAEFVRFLSWISEQHRAEPDSTGETQLDGDVIDAIFTNAMCSPAEEAGAAYELFDQEWIYGHPVPTSWLVLRNVLALLVDRDLFSRRFSFRSFSELYDRLCERLGTTPRLDRDLELEVGFQTLATKADPRQVAESLRLEIERPFGHPLLPPRKPGFLAEWADALETLEKLASTYRRTIGLQTEQLKGQEAGLTLQQEALGWFRERLDTVEEHLIHQRKAILLVEKALETERKGPEVNAITWLRQSLQEQEERLMHQKNAVESLEVMVSNTASALSLRTGHFSELEKGLVWLRGHVLDHGKALEGLEESLEESLAGIAHSEAARCEGVDWLKEKVGEQHRALSTFETYLSGQAGDLAKAWSILHDTQAKQEGFRHEIDGLRFGLEGLYGNVAAHLSATATEAERLARLEHLAERQGAELLESSRRLRHLQTRLDSPPHLWLEMLHRQIVRRGWLMKPLRWIWRLVGRSERISS